MTRPVALAAIVSVALVAIAGVVFLLANLSVDQPIAFNHRLHVEDVGLECTDCHLYAQTGERATIPNIQTCAGCHAEAAGDTAAEAQVVEHVESETAIPWRKVYWVPDDVFFSHRRHTALGGLECEVCHGSIRDRDAPITRQAVSIDMDRCMECHQERGVTNDCISCHR